MVVDYSGTSPDGELSPSPTLPVASDLGTQAPPVLWRGGGRSLQPCSLAGVAGSLLALVLSWLGCSVSQGLLPLPGDVCGWYTGHLLSLSPHLCNPHPAGNALVSPREGR